ncbi:hypothetical protein [Sandarakinorhabdus sp.]|uniref:hypothetical protein n=1 Tax=Sandarakinorhabdus sp. TaxID=1916663 RepID=UPI00286E76EA|nr:hypothetical protein [Sandarakinorhabdus sp.]
MLDFLDTLIGFTFVMLVLSLAVTAMAQALGAYLLELKGKALRQNLIGLLGRLSDKGIDLATTTIDQILDDPLLSSPKMFGKLFGGGRVLPSVIQREEFFRLLLDFAARAGTLADGTPAPTVTPLDKARQALKTTLADHGIPDPIKTLQALRLHVLSLERSHPDLSSSARATMAMLAVAGDAATGGDFVGKLNGWYDQTIDRAEELFTRYIRVVTSVIAVVLVFWLHFNSLDLINRLSVNKDLRNTLVEHAISQYQSYTPPVAGSAPDAAAAAKSTACASSAFGGTVATGADAAVPGANDYLRCMGLGELAGFEILSMPHSLGEWTAGWSRDPSSGQPRQLIAHVFGLLISVALLSLGAPFWYSALGNFLRLRSVLAIKDDKSREERQMRTEP